ncbi:acyltransferase [Psychromonas sp. RZ22]|uniref:acyltransferase n=1 Tax=Psychromonas algarum TaxID=2555643 RepID=UPI0010677AED|nr:acyltransferase family protein [Psychromonas sp. RZ22]TEW53274.1 acyltransferase [Psychromonas sp. RZ22]
MKVTRQSIFYIDFLRFIAAIAVISIHVLGPFRYLYGEIPTSDWLAATGINSLTRWAVPVFMLISGALLLSTEKAFQCEYYLSKRLSKVAIPFIGWTVIYALVAGFMVNEVFTGHWVGATALHMLENSPNKPVWYHLWFFYDFIPLYFVIPFLIPILKKASPEYIKLALFAWTVLFLMYWLKVESFLQQNLILYSGYLVLGWYLFNRDNRPQLKAWVTAGLFMMAFNFLGSWQLAIETGEYNAFFMGYKTLNTAIIAGMLFVVAQTYADKIQGKLRSLVTIISTYSLGIYLIHPLLLIPIRELDNGFYTWFGSNWIAIPMITVLTLAVSLFLTMILVKIPFVRRLVP